MKKGSDVTTNGHRHLRNTHSLYLNNIRSQKQKRKKEDEKDELIVRGPQVKGLTTVINVDEFCYRLTYWMVNRHVAFIEVKNFNF